MKKLLLSVVSGLMVLSLAACSTDTATTTEEPTQTEETAMGYTGPVDYVSPISDTLESLDYVSSAHAADNQHYANFVDGLLENDQYGKYVPALAESYTSNDEKTEFTFNLRQGVNWVTSEGEEYDEVRAQDFVTGLQHAADFDSDTAWLVQGVIKNFSEYMAGEVTFDQVGVEAVDDYTLKYTLETSTPYFDTMTTYGILFPINQEFLESKGAGCKLGEPDTENCDFGTAQPDGILYNGGYILTENTSKSQIKYVKNDDYWDADKVYLESITYYYDDGSDRYSTVKGFEQGTYFAFGLDAGWEDYDDYAAKYADNVRIPLPNTSTFNINFNTFRTNFEETGHETDAEKANVTAATQNVNFRKAFLAAFDKFSYGMQTNKEEVAKIMMRNVYTFPNLVFNSEGKSFDQLVTEEFNKLDTGFDDVDLADGANPFLNKEKALEFIEAAKADGITFPVSLDLIIRDDAQAFSDRAQSMKDSVETNTDGNILINVIPLDRDNALKYAYYSFANHNDTSFDIDNMAGWGADYPDPRSFLDTYGVNGDFISLLGLAPASSGEADSDAMAEAQGIVQFQAMLDEAAAITDDFDARYQAYAKAEAYLLSTGLIIPYASQTISLTVSKVVPFTKPYANAGIGMEKFKGMQLSDEIITSEEYEAAKADFYANQG